MRSAVLVTLVFVGCSGDSSRVPFELIVLTTGGGTVEASPPGLTAIDCGPTCRASYDNYDSAPTVELTATPDPGQTFLGWEGPCEGMGACSVTVNDVVSVSAMFGPPTSQWAHSADNSMGVAACSSAESQFVSATNTTLGPRQISLRAYESNGETDWELRSSGETGVVSDVACTTDGHTIVTGTFASQLRFVGLTIDSPTPAAFLLDVDVAGAPVELTGFATGPANQATSVARTSDGYAVLGTFETTVTVGTTTLTALGSTDIYVAKREGPTQWISRSIGSAADDLPLAIAGDGNGNLWVLVNLGESTTIDGEPLSAGTSLLILDQGLGVNWATSFHDDPHDPQVLAPGAIVTLPDGGAVIAFTFAGSVSSSAEYAAALTDWFVQRRRSDYSVVWEAEYGGSGYDVVSGLDVQGTDLIVGGGFVRDMTLAGARPLYSHGTTTNVSEYTDDGFVAVLDIDTGSANWARRVGGWDLDRVSDVAAGTSGVFAVGVVGWAPLAMGTSVVPSPNSEHAAFDILIAQ